MDNNISNTVYILSGPAGIGKSTTSKLLARTLSPSAYISSDAISHMHVNGREKPWESKKELSLIWDNILWADKDTVLQRDAQRKPEHQMGERCLILIDEFLSSGLDAKHLLKTTGVTINQMDLIIEAITNNPKYVMK
jgi:replication-associated recombination protein RarA